MPFSFIRDYFEVYGSLNTMGKGPPKFEWNHSNAKINYPKGTYDPKGIFMYFENYNVEVTFHMQSKRIKLEVNYFFSFLSENKEYFLQVRDRVKCISASEGVPVSTQWEPQGYYYPTQIAQFGLSHYR